MEIRTDLAVESYENGGKTLIDGVKVEENENVTVVSVLNNNGAAALGKPIGKYITYCADTSLDDTQIFDGRLDDLSKILSSLLPSGVNSVLVAGLGNSDITADALGPKAVNYVLATRHIINDLSENNDYFSQFFNVSSISTGVLGDTGIESAEIIKGVANQISPDCVIAKQTLGVPVISIGIPTVVSTSVICGNDDSSAMFVTPREIDRIIEHGAKLIGMTVNMCLQKNIDAKDLFSLVG